MSSSDAYIGMQFEPNGFEIREKIGEGGMSAVYKAIHPSSGQVQAVKILHMKFASDDEFVKRFRREATALRNIDHPNILKVYDSGILDDGTVYMFMEYLPGGSIHHLIQKNGPISLRNAIDILKPLAEALHVVHERGLIHRDLKTENILVCNGTTPKLIDFGLAKVTQNKGISMSTALTKAGDVLGTPAFMSPEQQMSRPLDRRTDIYSLGVVFYEMITGRLPFAPKSNSLVEDPIPLHKVGNYPEGLWEIVCKALAKKPDERFASAIEFANALNSFHTQEITTPTAKETPKSNRVKMIVALGFVVLLALSAFFVLK